MEKKIQRFRKISTTKTQTRIKLRRVFFSKMVLIALLLLAQLLTFILFTLRLQQYFAYFIGASVIFSTVFLMYLVNLPGKNEFKIAWILPVLVMPVFGISLYFMYKYNQGGISLKKKLAAINEDSKDYIPEKKKVRETAGLFPEVKNISWYLYNESGYVPYADCESKYFSCGEDFFEDVLMELKKAKKFIFLEFFIVEPSQIMDQILEVLTQKVKNGVEVRILFDSIGSIALSSTLLKKYFKSAGIESKVWLRFIPVFNTGLNNRDHRKIISIDGKTAYTGGVNITDEYANIYSKRFNYWKDAGIKIKGNAAHTFTLMFLQMWNVQNSSKEQHDDFSKYISSAEKLKLSKGNKSDLKKGLMIPYGDDAYNNEDIAENVYRYILIKATKKVCIMSPYLIIDNTLLDDLIFTAKRGIEVELILPMHYDHFISFCVGRTYIKNLIENGIKVYAYESGFIHSKVFIGDSKIGTVGSVNLDYRSFYHHFECGVFLYGTESVKDAQKDFDLTKADCKEIRIDDYKKIKWYIRMTGWIFRIIGPLL